MRIKYLSRIMFMNSQVAAKEILARSPGRPINTTDSARPKRTKSTPMANVCVFSSCSFCPNDTAGSLHRAFSDGIGERLIEIKLKTQDDQVRTCVCQN